MSIEHLLGPDEFFQRFQGRFFGKHRALVVEDNDPRKLGRVKVYCPSVYGEDPSPWAWPNFPFGGSFEYGLVFVPPKESFVWLEFEEGLPEHPIYTGGFYSETFVGRPSDGSPIEENQAYQDIPNPAPAHIQGQPDGSDLDGSMKGKTGIPASNFQGKYPNVGGLFTRSGHFLEFDDTKGNERIQMYHKSGAHYEFLPDGSLNVISPKKLRTYAKSRVDTTDGPKTEVHNDSGAISYKKTLTLNIGGTYTVDIGGDHNCSVGGDDNYNVSGSAAWGISGALDWQTLGDGKMIFGGGLQIGAQGNLNISSMGFGTIQFSNAQNVANPAASSLKILGLGGQVSMYSADPTTALSQIGWQAQALASGTLSPVRLPGGDGPFLKLGRVTAPFAKTQAEKAVVGETLLDYLTFLHDTLNALIVDYAAHVNAANGPSPSAIAFGTANVPAMVTARASYLSPLPPASNQAILSDIVYITKQ